RPNSFGLFERKSAPLIIRAGDCREALGAVTAEVDGARAADEALAHLRGEKPSPTPARIDAERRAQLVLKELFRTACMPTLEDLPDDTVLCRCENGTVGTLKAMLARNPG